MEEIKQIIEWLRSHCSEAAEMLLDSRKVKKGDVFAAIVGKAADGRRFIESAVEKGASCVLAEAGEIPATSVPVYQVKNLNAKIGEIAAAFYGNASKSMIGIAVTGTNGKTSTTHWISSMLSAAGTSCAVIGTIGCRLGEESIPVQSLTTPDSVTLQALLSELSRRGAASFVVEASSIGLEQGRLSGTDFRVALFTNLTRDHLDYHVTMENYEAAKGILFAWPTLKTAVINMDDPAGVRFAEKVRERGIGLIGCSRKEYREDWLCATDIGVAEKGMAFTLCWKGSKARIHTTLHGLFNIENLLGAAGVAMACGLSFERVSELLASVKPPKGRMEVVGNTHRPLVLVDYAHTPDAVTKAIDALRPAAEARGGRLWVLLGAGGDRDPGKRIYMGQAAATADVPLITSDNPRTEDPKKILEQVAQGAPHAKQILDRAEAIAYAVSHADDQDVILIAGKGHEDYQDIQGVKIHFSDSEEAVKALDAREKVKTCQNH